MSVLKANIPRLSLAHRTAHTEHRDETLSAEAAETIIVPVLPSSIDMKACGHFMAELLEIGKVSRKQARLAVIANRVREYTLIYEELDQYLTKLKVPYLGCLREAQNYVRAYARGMGVLELPEYLAWPDWQQWEPIFEWLDSKRSQPAA